jgi:predicted dehydrogenase
MRHVSEKRDQSMNAPPSPLRILAAGAGAFGREHLDRLVRRSDATVVGVADTNAAALELACARYGVANRRADPLRLIDEIAADAIIVATPAASHVEIGLRALGQKLCVLLEKPVASSSTAVAPLLAATQSSAGFVLPGHVLRFSRDHLRLVEIVRSGRIGKVIYVNSRRYRDDSHAFRYPDADPVLMTLIHDIDLAQWVTRSAFRSVLARRSQGAGFRSMTAVSATTTTGIICDLRTAWTFTDGDLPPDRLEVVGDAGSVELVAGHSLHVYAEGRRMDDPVAVADDPLQNEQDHFLACIRDRSRKPALDLSEALAGLKLADAAIESLSLDREVMQSG